MPWWNTLIESQYLLLFHNFITVIIWYYLIKIVNKNKKQTPKVTMCWALLIGYFISCSSMHLSDLSGFNSVMSIAQNGCNFSSYTCIGRFIIWVILWSKQQIKRSRNTGLFYCRHLKHWLIVLFPQINLFIYLQLQV